jgi:hypothetical protein
MLVTGMPVQPDTTAAISSELTAAAGARSDAFPVLARFLDFLVQLLLVIPDRRGTLKVLALDGRLLFRGQRLLFRLKVLQVGRKLQVFHTDAGGRLVDEVDRLVRQISVVYIPDGHLDSGVDGFIRDLELMMGLVFVSQALEDLDRFLRRGLADGHRLEAPLQRRVLFHVLSVLVEGRGADHLDLAAPKGRLNDIGRVDCALGSARADDRVQLVDKQYYVPGLHHLVHRRFDALFKVASVFCARDHPDRSSETTRLSLSVSGTSRR